MIGIILTGHGNFASGLYSSIKLIAGEKEEFECCDFVEGMGADEDLVPMLEKAIEKLSVNCEGVLIFSDLKGGSPFQKAAALSFGKDNIEVLTGTNLAMLLEVAIAREFVPELSELTKMAVATGKEQVYHYVFEQKIKTNECEDGI